MNFPGLSFLRAARFADQFTPERNCQLLMDIYQAAIADSKASLKHGVRQTARPHRSHAAPGER